MADKKCPVCETIVLVDLDLEPGLAARTCSQCHGTWVPAASYWSWRDSLTTQPVETPPTAAAPAVADSRPAKRCPDCGHFLAHTRVGHGIAFHLDRCTTCGGMWFDAGEWDTLHSRGMHAEVHQIFSPGWQAAVAREDRQLAHDQLLRGKLGDADFAEAKRVKAWIETHPHRVELYAYITPDLSLKDPGKDPKERG